MDSLDIYLDRRYNSKSYTCYHFTSDVWKDLTGIDLSDVIHRLFTNGKLDRAHVKRFVELDKPVSPCIVVMQRGRTVPHIGVYVDGSILHIHGTGVEFQNPVTATRGFHSVRYVTCKS